MKLRLFSILDVKGELFGPMMPVRTTQEAMRAFHMQYMNPETMINQWPEDYVLYEIGTWDPTTGQITSLENKHNLGSAQENFGQQLELMEEAN